MSAETVTLNGRFVTQAITGVQRHAWEVVKALDRLLTDGDRAAAGWPRFELLVPQGFAPKVAGLSSITVREVGSRSGHAWEQLDLPRFAAGRIVSLCNTFPVLARRPLVVVHDAAIYAFPQGYTFAFRACYRLLYWIAAKRPRVQIVTDSEFSRRELAKYVGLTVDRIVRVYCGADHWSHVEPNRSVIDRLGLGSSRYFLAVASANPNKNLARLIEAYRLLDRPDIPLVLVGGTNKRVFADVEEDDVPGVIRTGYVSDSELAALYVAARAFIFPSLYEGFGLPPLEAMTFSCPVISSREASLPEVCGEAALYCDVRDPKDIAEAMARMLHDDAEHQRLQTAGLERINQFTWKSTAQAMLNLLLKQQMR